MTPLLQVWAAKETDKRGFQNLPGSGQTADRSISCDLHCLVFPSLFSFSKMHILPPQQKCTTRDNSWVCHRVCMPVPLRMLFSLPGMLSLSALSVHKHSVKCYLPLKPSLFFSDNWSAPLLSSTTCNTKWQVLIYRFVYLTRLSSLEHRLKVHPSPVPYPAPRMKGSFYCP